MPDLTAVRQLARCSKPHNTPLALPNPPVAASHALVAWSLSLPGGR
jgi:hypothetical protein